MAKRLPGQPIEELQSALKKRRVEEEVMNGLEQGLGLPEAIREILVRINARSLGAYTRTQRQYGLDDAYHARFIDLTWRLLVHQTFRSPLQEDGRPYACVQAFEDLHLREVKPLLGSYARVYDHYWQRAYAAISMYLTWVVWILGHQTKIAVDWPSLRCYEPMGKAVQAVKAGILHPEVNTLSNSPFSKKDELSFAVLTSSILPSEGVIPWFNIHVRMNAFPADEHDALYGRFDQEILARGESTDHIITLKRDEHGKPLYFTTGSMVVRASDGPVTWKSTAVIDEIARNPFALVGTGDRAKTYRYRDQPVLVARIDEVWSLFIAPDNILRQGVVNVESFHLDRYLAYLVDDYKQAPMWTPAGPSMRQRCSCRLSFDGTKMKRIGLTLTRARRAAVVLRASTIPFSAVLQRSVVLRVSMSPVMTMRSSPTLRPMKVYGISPCQTTRMRFSSKRVSRIMPCSCNLRVWATRHSWRWRNPLLIPRTPWPTRCWNSCANLRRTKRAPGIGYGQG